MAAAHIVGTFAVWDYVVFALMLLVSAAVGVYCAMSGGGQQSSQDFLMGGRKMTAVPVALSLTATFMSAITVLATPSEVYQYGAMFILFTLSYSLMVFVTSEVFLPIFYRLGVTSTYEYLEMRFKVLYTGIVIYVPALALKQVTGFDLWGAVMSTGIVCTFYCSLGGLKAVVWTDVFQLATMMAGFLVVIIRAVLLHGGFSVIIDDSQKGGRLNLWDFDPNPFKRHTFWTITFGGAFVWIGIYGVSQAQVQRYVSCKSLNHARTSLYLNLVGLWAILLCAVFSGLCLYAIYQDCDPWTAGLISAPDQLMPYLVMDILRDYPGLPGLFVAAAFSGTLSTVSSSINALAAVTVEDLVKPYISMSDRKLSWISKGLSLFYGAVCIGMAAIASLLGGLLEAALSIFGIIGGPLVGLFSLGIFCPFANSTGGLVGLFSGLGLSLWLGIWGQLYPPYHSEPLSLSTAGCNFTVNPGGQNWTQSLMIGTDFVFWCSFGSAQLVDGWYSLSYLYFSPAGAITVFAVGVIMSLLTGGKKLKLAPELRLMKEDLTCYCLYNIFKQKVVDIYQVSFQTALQ
uniref:Solute carrier family 5 member 8 n=1 Tax=Scleropages formosus TaxID=113540 RepID=A0A8C9WQ01_SCLFO